MNPRVIAVIVGLVVVAGAAIAALEYMEKIQQQPIAEMEAPQPKDPASSSPEVSANPTPANTPTAAAGQEPTAMKTPDLTVDSNGLSKTTVVIRTNRGVIKYKFYPQDAPTTVNRMIELIQSGFYSNVVFHRVVPGFVIQTGDPTGKGTGGSGKNLKAEFNRRKHVDGAVAMARAADPDSADSQFYITLGTHPHLDGNYTVFGQVVEGMDVARKIQVGDKMESVWLE